MKCLAGKSRQHLREKIACERFKYVLSTMGIFSRGDNVDLLLILFRLLTMQCKCTFTKHFTLSTPKKCHMLRPQSQKCASLAAIAKYIMIYDNLQNNLSPDFQSRALLLKEAFGWSLKKLQIMTLIYLARLVSVTSK